MNKTEKIRVRMYRIATGDCFLLQFYDKEELTLRMIIDCGAINSTKEEFENIFDDIKRETNGKIDLLIVTHEHSDHTNGLTKFSKSFYKEFDFRNVWFAWTEGNEPYANQFRKEHVKIKKAVNIAVAKLNSLNSASLLEDVLKDDEAKEKIIAANTYFLNSMNFLNELNATKNEFSLNENTTMVDILKERGIIRENTAFDFLQPGQVIENIEGAVGIRFLVLGPPKDYSFIKVTERKDEGYDKRDNKNDTDLLFKSMMLSEDEPGEGSNLLPFDEDYILNTKHDIKSAYSKPEAAWRKIDFDWLGTSASLAMRLESLTNNTSLVLAIQFIDSEKILLFSGDAQHGNWLSWHENLKWKIKNKDNQNVKVDIGYILQNTVLYKVGHHLSHNGTLKGKGLEMMTNDEFAALVSLDLANIGSGWDSTMPNDQIGEDLIRRTNGKVLFLGDRGKIIDKIKTSRTSISKKDLETIEKLNSPYDDKLFIDYTVEC